MFRMVFGGKNTCKPLKQAVPGSKREQFSNYTMKTLGSGDLLGAVKLPEGEELNEWLAANTVDFFNEVNLIWDIVNEIGVENVAVGAGFPPGFEYRWADSRNKSPTACSGPQYVQHVISWVEGEINNEQLFPTSPSVPFPKNFLSSLERMGAVAHLNTSFKHFLYFVWEFDLVQPSELEALKDIVQEIQSRYETLLGRARSGSKDRMFGGK
eukprot:scaffold11522_cov239-Ochromonas_danica.AAC.7